MSKENNQENVDILSEDSIRESGLMKSKKSKIITGIMFVILVGVIAWIAYGWANGMEGFGF